MASVIPNLLICEMGFRCCQGLDSIVGSIIIIILIVMI